MENVREVIRYAAYAVADGFIDVFNNEDTTFNFVEMAGRLVFLANKDDVSASDVLEEIGILSIETWAREVLQAVKDGRLPKDGYGSYKDEEEKFRARYGEKTDFEVPHINWV